MGSDLADDNNMTPIISLNAAIKNMPLYVVRTLREQYYIETIAVDYF